VSKTKTFSAKQMHNSPRQVFREADKTGKVKINHDHYPDKVFELIARDRAIEFRHVQSLTEDAPEKD